MNRSLSLSNESKIMVEFRQKTILLCSVDFSITEGESAIIWGAPESGKFTLLNILGTINTVFGGSVEATTGIVFTLSATFILCFLAILNLVHKVAGINPLRALQYE